MKNNKQAVVLLSGGLDSATVLYLARSLGYKCTCLIFDYGQKHLKEVKAAQKIARSCGCGYKILKIFFPWKGSSLLDRKKEIPQAAGVSVKQIEKNIPSTYVPGRNIIFLSFAVSFAEAIKAEAIFIGVHSQDYSGYPDCRMEFIKAFAKAARCGTKAGVNGRGIKILAPLIHKHKAQVIRLGSRLKVPFALTWSCYHGASGVCGKCDSCYYRQKGFQQAGLKDPLIKI